MTRARSTIVSSWLICNEIATVGRSRAAPPGSRVKANSGLGGASRSSALAPPCEEVGERSGASGERLRSSAQRCMWWCAVGVPGSGAYGVAMRMHAGSWFRFGCGVRRGGFGRAGLGIVAVVFGWHCLLVAVAAAAVPRSTWVTNGPVSSVVAAGDRVYIGGEFTYVGPNTGSGVLLGLKRGSRARPFAKVKGSVLAVVSDGAGGYYVGGWFDRVGSVPRANLAHIDANGSVDPAWNPNPNYDGGVDALALSGSTVYVGGFFASIGGQPRRGIAAVDAHTGRVSAWNPNANGPVAAFAVSGSTIYAGGAFTSVGGRARRHIAALDAGTGRASAWNPNANGPVAALAISGSTIYAGGRFTTIGGQARNDIAALDTGSGLASAWNPNATGDIVGEGFPSVLALVVSRSTVYAGGDFLTIGGDPQEGFAAFPISG
jgi:hypothetical protein